MSTPATTPADEIAACPFCDDPDGECAESAVPNKFAVYCNGCFCEGPTANTEDAAIAAWNRRAAPSPGKAPEPVVPSGMAIVPIHPTKEMREAGAKIGNQGWDFAHHTWRTMLLHAPIYASPGKAGAERWMPIETAPKDGTEIWAFNGEQARMQWSEGEEWALWCWADEHLSDVDPNPDQPTHWMPLPAAPRAIQQERDGSNRRDA